VQLFLTARLFVALHSESKSLPGCSGRAWQADPKRRKPCMLSCWRIDAFASYTPYRTKRGRTLAPPSTCIRLEYAVPLGASLVQGLTFEAVEVPVIPYLDPLTVQEACRSLHILAVSQRSPLCLQATRFGRLGWGRDSASKRTFLLRPHPRPPTAPEDGTPASKDARVTVQGSDAHKRG
jgi:hypothetical protein